MAEAPLVAIEDGFFCFGSEGGEDHVEAEDVENHWADDEEEEMEGWLDVANEGDSSFERLVIEEDEIFFVKRIQYFFAHVFDFFNSKFLVFFIK